MKVTLNFLFSEILGILEYDAVVSSSVPRGCPHKYLFVFFFSFLVKKIAVIYKINLGANLGDNEIQVTIALANLAQLESDFWAVSDPKNVDYGKKRREGEGENVHFMNELAFLRSGIALAREDGV